MWNNKESRIWVLICQPFWVLPAFWGHHVNKEVTEGGKKGFQKFHSPSKLSLEPKAYIFKLPAYLCCKQVLMSSSSWKPEANTFKQSSSSCKLLCPFCLADTQLLPVPSTRPGWRPAAHSTACFPLFSSPCQDKHDKGVHVVHPPYEMFSLTKALPQMGGSLLLPSASGQVLGKNHSPGKGMSHPCPARCGGWTHH